MPVCEFFKSIKKSIQGPASMLEVVFDIEKLICQIKATDKVTMTEGSKILNK